MEAVSRTSAHSFRNSAPTSHIVGVTSVQKSSSHAWATCSHTFFTGKESRGCGPSDWPDVSAAIPVIRKARLANLRDYSSVTGSSGKRSECPVLGRAVAQFSTQFPSHVVPLSGAQCLTLPPPKRARSRPEYLEKPGLPAARIQSARQMRDWRSASMIPTVNRRTGRIACARISVPFF